ncbi:outer membrane beta-barrel protein [Nonlabens sp. SCSIO 43208]|uniref:CsgG/HfaB family protein n=1 Tax=Nonlabens sp. SCSIO 43208 TaxID=2793009 RepID=UPI003D6BAF12
MRLLKLVVILLACIVLQGCGAYFNQPLDTQDARIGETTKVTDRLRNLPPPIIPAVVGVYKFEDQTGQFKLSEVGSTFSNAVTQGGTTILIKALEDSGWFRPIERENLTNLITERNLILDTRRSYAKQSNTQMKDLDPLLYAGILIEGGIVSYDTNVLTGGAGARYFGAGGSTKYRQDRVTVYLRAVSTKSGEILKTVYVSKTIFSQAVDASLFRYVSFQRLLEAETGFTRNEPGQLAIKEAIEKAVESLIIEGITVNLWSPAGGQEVATAMVRKYNKEKEVAERTDVYQRDLLQRRSKLRIDLGAGGTYMQGDLPNADYEHHFNVGLKYNFNPYLGVRGNLSQLRLNNEGLFNEQFHTADLNAEVTLLPFESFTPHVYGGAGVLAVNGISNFEPKLQVGAGFEYALTPSFGIQAFGEYNMTFTDELDGTVAGKRDDNYYRVGIGLNFYLGDNQAKQNNLTKQQRKARRRQKRSERKQLRESLKKAKELDALSRPAQKDDNSNESTNSN